MVKSPKFIVSCSNFITSFLLLSFFEEIICPLNKNNLFFSTTPFSAMIVVLLILEIFEDKFFRLFLSSCKKIFLSSLFTFFSTKKVKPLNESLNC